MPQLWPLPIFLWEGPRENKIPRRRAGGEKRSMPLERKRPMCINEPVSWATLAGGTLFNLACCLLLWRTVREWPLVVTIAAWWQFGLLFLRAARAHRGRQRLGKGGLWPQRDAAPRRRRRGHRGLVAHPRRRLDLGVGRGAAAPPLPAVPAGVGADGHPPVAGAGGGAAAWWRWSSPVAALGW